MVLLGSPWFSLVPGGLFSDVQLGPSSFLPLLPLVLLVKSVGSRVSEQETGPGQNLFWVQFSTSQMLAH